MEHQETQSPVQYAAESLDKLESSLSTTRNEGQWLDVLTNAYKLNISSGEDAFLNEELKYDCAI